jgi:dimethylhistidine N-methyltransferase
MDDNVYHRSASRPKLAVAPDTLVEADTLAEALAGLSRPQKTLPPKLFYDDAGCRLFRRITELPEYYLTRTERVLLTRIAPALAMILPPRGVLVEYGASDESKAELLLRQTRADAAALFADYVAIDIAAAALHDLRNRLRWSHPDLAVHLVAADFQRPLTLPSSVPDGPRLGFFPGSTIGNMEPAEAGRFMRQARQTLGDGARFVVGVDLRKDPDKLIAAYDDAAGVTAAFNRNLLVRLNREAGADFDPAAFAHAAVWNAAHSRIEMHLVSRREQVVHIGGHRLRFAAGETIHTENSYKHTPEGFAALVIAAGWRHSEMWTDPDRLFSLHLLTAGG